MSNLRTFLAVSAASAAISFAAPAGAAVVVGSGDAGTEYVINYTGQVGGSTEAGISALLKLTFTGISGNSYNFSYDLTNTSSLESRLRSFGFDTDPNISGAAASGVYDNVEYNNNFPESFGTVDVCFRADGGNVCTGGPNGLAEGANAIGTLSLTFGSAQESISLDRFVTRFQSIEGSNYGNSGIGVGTPVPAVPEPATWALMLAGFGAIGWGMRRRKATDGQPRMRVVYN